MTRPLDIVFFGLSLSSSWGNGHATTYRALLRGLADEGHRCLFLERDQPWYAAHRDLPHPGFCDFALYDDLGAVDRWARRIARADAVIVGSYVPEAIALIDRLVQMRPDRLAFYDIDTPITLQALAEGDADYLARCQVPQFDLMLSFAGGAALAVLAGLGAQRAEPLFCSVDPDRYRPMAEPKKWDLGYLGTYSADRQPTLDRLLLEPARRLPRRRFVVAGPQYPDDIDWPDNVDRIDHLPPDDHPAFYARQRFTLNVTREAMRALGHSPSVRLFEAAACGTPILSDRWPGLTQLLPDGAALRIVEDADDVVAALGLDDDDTGRLAAEARRIVLTGHTGRARAQQLAGALASIPAAKEISQ